MVLKRVIPTLLLQKQSLVKTVRFSKPHYIGDPANTVRIFNEMEVDELCFLDITATKEGREPNYTVLAEIVDECFMPLSYGGGITTIEQAKKILGMGFEKVVINSAAFKNPDLIPAIVDTFGSQSVIGSVDVKKTLFGGQKVFSRSGSKKENYKALDWCKRLQEMGVGEILLTSIDQDGTWNGYDTALISEATEALDVPVIASGGCGSVADIDTVLNECKAQAAGVGSMVVFQKQGMGVLVNFPDRKQLDKIING